MAYVIQKQSSDEGAALTDLERNFPEGKAHCEVMEIKWFQGEASHVLSGKTLVGQTPSSSTEMRRGKKLHSNTVEMETYTYTPLPPTQPWYFYNHNAFFVII